MRQGMWVRVARRCPVQWSAGRRSDWRAGCSAGRWPCCRSAAATRSGSRTPPSLTAGPVPPPPGWSSSRSTTPRSASCPSLWPSPVPSSLRWSSTSTARGPRRSGSTCWCPRTSTPSPGWGVKSSAMPRCSRARSSCPRWSTRRAGSSPRSRPGRPARRWGWCGPRRTPTTSSAARRCAPPRSRARCTIPSRSPCWPPPGGPRRPPGAAAGPRPGRAAGRPRRRPDQFRGAAGHDPAPALPRRACSRGGARPWPCRSAARW